MSISDPTGVGSSPAYVVVTDFDGTAAEHDVQQALLDALADRQAWREINACWAKGELTTAQRAREQWALIDAPESEVLAVLDGLRLDPFFPQFVALCRAREYSLYIVSDGFDFYIEPMLAAAGIRDVPVIANHLRYVDGRPQLSFLHQRSPDQYYGNDKTYVIERVREPKSALVFIGDGHSDRDAAHHADLLFAKDHLAEYCRAEELPYQPYSTFEQICAYFSGLPQGKPAHRVE